MIYPPFIFNAETNTITGFNSKGEEVHCIQITALLDLCKNMNAVEAMASCEEFGYTVSDALNRCVAKAGEFKYMDDIPEYGEVMHVDDFKDFCYVGAFCDEDGTGYLVKDNKMCNSFKVIPSKMNLIPKDVTHIVWFNR